jgi:hypothetical protein
MPAIIGAFNNLKPAPTATTSTSAPAAASAARQTTTSSTGVPDWARITSSGGITVSKPPAQGGRTGGTSSSGNGMVPVSGYTGYRNVIDAIRNNAPPGVSSDDWTLTFQLNTSFDKSIIALIGDPKDPSIGYNANGALVDSSGNLIAGVIWFAVTIPAGQLVQLGAQQFSNGLSVQTKILWVSSTTAASSASAPPDASKGR